MNHGSQMNHPIRGSGLKLRTSTLDDKVRVRRPIDVGNQEREQMRNNKDKPHRNRTGRGAANALADSRVCTAEQRATVRQGLRLLARMITRAHLGRQGGTEQRTGARSSAGC